MLGLAATPVSASLFSCAQEDTSNATTPIAPKATPIVVTEDASGIISMRLRIDGRGQITVLDSGVIDGRWEDSRTIPVGRRLYYEVLDKNGTVITRGYKRDPRGMLNTKSTDFFMTAPYYANAACVTIYLVDYENGGKSGYARDYSLLASVDIDAKATASVH
jgi:hypothetical protein